MTRILPATTTHPALRLAISPRLDGWRVLAVDDTTGFRLAIWRSIRCTRATAEIVLGRMVRYPEIMDRGWRRGLSRRRIRQRV